MIPFVKVATTLVQNKGAFRLFPNADGTVDVVVSNHLTRKMAAHYLGLGMNQFNKIKFTRNGNGHRPYLLKDLDDYTNSQSKAKTNGQANTETE